LNFEIRIKTTAAAVAQTLAAPEPSVRTSPGAGDDAEVMEWFKEEGTSGATRDTVRLDASETIATQRESIADLPPAEGEDDPSPAKSKKGAQPVARPLHKDSQEAASAVLRQLFKGR
jgi:hypothetical protein